MLLHLWTFSLTVPTHTVTCPPLPHLLAARMPAVTGLSWRATCCWPLTWPLPPLRRPAVAGLLVVGLPELFRP